MNTFVRKASAGDLDFISRCAELVYEKYVSRMNKKPAPMVDDFAKRIAKNQVDVLVVNSKSAGFAIWYLEEDRLFLENIAIHPNFQNKGLARELLNHLEKTAKANNKAAIELYTNEKMTENLSLYPYLGFRETDRHNQDGFNRVFYTKNLV